MKGLSQSIDSSPRAEAFTLSISCSIWRSRTMFSGSTTRCSTSTGQVLLR